MSDGLKRVRGQVGDIISGADDDVRIASESVIPGSANAFVSKRAKTDAAEIGHEALISTSCASSSMSSFSSAAAAAIVSTETAILNKMESLVSSLLSPIVTQLRSINEQLQSQSAAVSSLRESHASLSASVSFMKEDVAILVKTALPLTLVGGGLRTTNVLSALHGAHGIGEGIFGFLDCKDGNNLRLVCHEMRTAVAAFPWNDKETCIKGSLCSWRSCFPNARAANIGVKLGNADFRFFRGLHYLDVSEINSFSDAAFSQLSGLKYLYIQFCTQLTDAIFPHLVGLETLIMDECPQAGITGTAFEPLRGSIQEIGTEGCRRVVKAAARAIAPRSMAEYWYNIALALPAGGSHVLEDGRSMNTRQLYLECLRLCPQHSYAFNNLGLSLTSSERVTLPDGRSMNQRELFLEAIKLDPRYESAYANLALGMTADERVRLLDGRSMSKRELFLGAIRIDPQLARAYIFLAATLTAEERVELPDGRRMSKHELFLESLRHQPGSASTFANLAQYRLSDDEMGSSPYGRSRSLRLDSRLANIFYDLSITLTAEERAELPDGRHMNKREVYFECLRYNPRYANAFANLAFTATSATERISLPDGRSMNQRELHQEALRIKPHCIFALENLAATMTATETVTLPDNRVMTQEQLLASPAH